MTTRTGTLVWTGTRCHFTASPVFGIRLACAFRKETGKAPSDRIALGNFTDSALEQAAGSERAVPPAQDYV